MKLHEFLKNKDLMREYVKWANSPIVQALEPMLQESFCQPLTPSTLREQINKNTCEYILGENSGSWKMLGAIFNLAAYGVNEAGEIVPATYEPEEPEQNNNMNEGEQ